jgi:hypothetical protein
MALTSAQLDEVQAVAHNAFEKIMPDQFLVSSAFGNMMSKAPNLQYLSGGSKIQQPVQIAENQADGFIDGRNDVLDLSSNQQLSFAEFDYKYQNYNISITLDDITRTEGTPNAIKSLLVEKVNLAAGTAKRTYAKALHGNGSDSNGKAINGLGDVTAASGTAYGGITNTDLDDSSTWLTEIDSGTTTINYASLNSLVGTLIARGQGAGDAAGSFAPDVMISNSFVQDKFLASQQSQQQFAPADDLEAGFVGCVYRGINWYIDDFSPGSADGSTADNFLYVLSTPTFALKYKYGFEGKKSPVDYNGRIPNQAIITSQHMMAYNLVCRARRYNGVFKALQS